jgi:peptide/nickel transport system substrate-binding protein
LTGRRPEGNRAVRGRARSAAAGVVAAALGLAACGGSRAHPAAPSAPPATVAPATTSDAPGAGLPLAVGPAPASYNCDAAGVDPASCLAVVDAVWPSVYRLDASGQPQLDTSFVTSASVTSTSPQVVTYHLNPKAEWSDGTPITWQDFAYTWQAQSGSAAYHDAGGAPFTPATTGGYEDIASVTGSPADPTAVVVTFARPDPDWQALFGAGHPVVPAHVATQVGFDHGFTDPVDDLVSGGPFLVQSAVPGQSVTLVRNPRWWGTAAALSSVTVRFTTAATELAPALARSIVAAAEITGPPGSTVSPDVYAAVRRADGVTVKAVPSTTYEVLELNEASGALADPALRKAILTAVSRDDLLKLVPGAADAGTDALGDRFALPGSDGYTDDTPSGVGAGDAGTARRVLQAAGYTAAAGAPLTKGGQPITLHLTGESGQPAVQAQEQAIVAALAQIGITVTESDTADVAATQAGGGWDLALSTATASPFPGPTARAYLPGDAANVEHVNDPQAAQALTAAATTLDPTKRAGLLHTADASLWTTAADLPLFQLPSVLAYRSDVAGATAFAGAEGPTAAVASWGILRSS